MRSLSVVWGVALAVALAACSERVQINNPKAERKVDVPGWKGGNAEYTVPGWTPGDEASWEAQLRRRAQNQNDFAPR
jgi:hypothetical protein